MKSVYLRALISLLVGLAVVGLSLAYHVQVSTIPGNGCANASPGAGLCVSLPTYVDNYGAPLSFVQGSHISGFSNLSNVKVNVVAGLADVLIFSLIVFATLSDINSRRQKKKLSQAKK